MTDPIMQDAFGRDVCKQCKNTGVITEGWLRGYSCSCEHGERRASDLDAQNRGPLRVAVVADTMNEFLAWASRNRHIDATWVPTTGAEVRAWIFDDIMYVRDANARITDAFQAQLLSRVRRSPNQTNVTLGFNERGQVTSITIGGKPVEQTWDENGERGWRIFASTDFTIGVLEMLMDEEE